MTKVPLVVALTLVALVVAFGTGAGSPDYHSQCPLLVTDMELLEVSVAGEPVEDMTPYEEVELRVAASSSSRTFLHVKDLEVGEEGLIEFVPEVTVGGEFR
ncbi:hypothetical protein FRC98_13575 [Lujinxingia vulgaris]|uniref:Uncharacterized protein n=1 Tax=Lujinxingia vulgaris TaxID=2600176 RepID=A0A5C6XBN3_9DELT|nr:hypothetical protein [Lujinxingia vulgaris]TXD36147.1 hypothetical protein FRC98_13575 [Lujinxingia vulgaris]